MSLPLRREAYVFETIAPKITPDGCLEWIEKTESTEVCVRTEGLAVSGIAEPIRVPLDVGHILSVLSRYRNNDVITFTHDADRCEDVLTNGKKDIRLRQFTPSSIPGMKETTAKLDKNGMYHAALNAQEIKSFFTTTRKDKRVVENRSITFDEANKQLTLSVEWGASDFVTQQINNGIFIGNGTVHFSNDISYLFRPLSGLVDIYAPPDGGSLWVEQNSKKQAVVVLYHHKNEIAQD